MLLKWEILWPLEIPHETAFSVVNTDYCSCVQLLAIQFLTIVFQNDLMVSNNHSEDFIEDLQFLTVTQKPAVLLWLLSL